jgi:hypothetical protein
MPELPLNQIWRSSGLDTGSVNQENHLSFLKLLPVPMCDCLFRVQCLCIC